MTTEANATVGPVVNALTIDVEDYFHVSVFDGLVPRSEWGNLESRVRANTERLIEILDGTKGTFFVLGWVAERFPGLVGMIAAAGHEVASHGFEHRLVYDQTPRAFREDVRRAKAILESASGTAVIGYRAPSYSITPRSLWALDVLIEEGYRYDSSIFPVRHDRYGIPLSPRHPYLITRASGTLLEAPASTTALGPFNLPVAGGGYFRILPVRLDPMGDQPGQPHGTAADDFLPASLGDRSRPTAAESRSARPVSPLPESGEDGAAVPSTARRFPLRADGRRPVALEVRGARGFTTMGVALPVVSVTADGPPLSRTAPHPAPAPVVCSVASAEREPEWDAFVRSRADASGYHLWRWRRVFEAGLGLRCHYVVATRHGHVTGVLPTAEVRSPLFGRALSSLPYVNYGGVVAEDLETASALVAYAAELARARSLSYVLLRHRERQMPELPARSHKVTMLLPLEKTSESMWSRLDRKVRNQVRKAEKSGVTVESGGLDLLHDFYRVFARNMRDLGTPVYGKKLFAAILNEFPDDARVHVARVNGFAIAGAVSYAYGDWIEVPSASSLREHRALCPNHLLYWSIMTAAIAAGRRVFDFGRSTPHDSTYHFKEQWGASPAQLWWEYRLQSDIPLPSTDRHSARLQARIEAWKRLPLAMATALGPHLARLVP